MPIVMDRACGCLAAATLVSLLAIHTAVVAGVGDVDEDGVDDFIDNCTFVSNPDQRDTNQDGYGNLCDPDLNNDGAVNFLDLAIIKSVFFQATNGDADLTGDGFVNFVDLAIAKQSFFAAPGPGVGDRLLAPVLNAANGVTMDNPFTVTGTAGSDGTIRLYVNGIGQATVAPVDAGSFLADAALFDGANNIRAALVIGQYESPLSNAIVVSYSNVLPLSFSGELDQPTVWTPRDGVPYDIVGNLTIAPGGSLVIQPGTTLRFANNTKLIVRGGLTVPGTAAQPVLFTSLSSSPNEFSWRGIEVLSESTGLSVEHAIIEYPQQAIIVNSVNAVIRNTTIRDFGISGVLIQANGGGEIVGNTIGDGFWTATSISLDAASSELQIANNTLFGNRSGIYCTDSSPAIYANSIFDTITGITVFRNSQPMIDGGNLLFDNDTAVAVIGTRQAGGDPAPVFSGNSVWNSKSYHFHGSLFHDPAVTRIAATNNWWGSTSIGEIAERIYDYSESASSPVVDFSNFLDAADGVPVITNLVLGGALSASQTWDAGVPYEMAGRALVQAGQIIAIPAATQLNFHDASAAIVVEGTLQIQGTAANPVILSSGLSGPKPGDWAGIIFATDAGTSSVEGAVIAYATSGVTVNGNQAGTTISNCVIRDYSLYGVRLENDALALVLGNTVENSPAAGNQIGISVDASDGLIENNTLLGADFGLYLTNASPVVAGNLVQNNGVGITVFGQSAPQIAGNNQVIANSTGIDILGGSPQVTGNSILQNSVGISLDGGDAAPSIFGNAIAGNDDYGVRINAGNNATNVPLGTSINSNDIFGNGGAAAGRNLFLQYTGVVTAEAIDATGNWWGTDNPQAGVEIGYSSLDYVDMIDFSGFATAPIVSPGLRLAR